MFRSILVTVLVLLLTVVLAQPILAQTTLPNPPFNQEKCFELSAQGAPFRWDVTTTKCVVSPPHR